MRTKAQAKSDAKWLVRKWAAAAGPIGVIPGSPLLLPAVDVKLIHDLANCFEVKNYSIDAVLGVVAASIAGRTAADIGLTTIPVAGWIIKGIVASSTTLAVGSVVSKYFEDRSQLP